MYMWSENKRVAHKNVRKKIFNSWLNYDIQNKNPHNQFFFSEQSVQYIYSSYTM